MTMKRTSRLFAALFLLTTAVAEDALATDPIGASYYFHLGTLLGSGIPAGVLVDAGCNADAVSSHFNRINRLIQYEPARFDVQRLLSLGASRDSLRKAGITTELGEIIVTFGDEPSVKPPPPPKKALPIIYSARSRFVELPVQVDSEKLARLEDRLMPSGRHNKEAEQFAVDVVSQYVIEELLRECRIVLEGSGNYVFDLFGECFDGPPKGYFFAVEVKWNRSSLKPRSVGDARVQQDTREYAEATTRDMIERLQRGIPTGWTTSLGPKPLQGDLRQYLRDVTHGKAEFILARVAPSKEPGKVIAKVAVFNTHKNRKMAPSTRHPDLRSRLASLVVP